MDTATNQLIRLAGTRGPLGFGEIMEVALYDPDAGFFAGSGGRAGGRLGDFITSPEVGPLFGAVIARWIDRRWAELGRPDRLVLVDWGAGPGTLARTILVADLECRDALDVLLVERSAAQRERHSDLGASSLGPEAAWDRLLGETDPVLVVANELLDNLAFDVAEWTGTAWAEVRFAPPDEPDGAWLPVLADLDDASAQRLGSLVSDPAPGIRVPLHREALEWVTSVLKLPTDGLLLFDYAATTSELAHRGDWLRTHQAHRRGTDPFANLGQLDITTDVAYDQLPPPDVRMAQADWLAANGVQELVDDGRRVWSELGAAGGLSAFRARSRVSEVDVLLDPAGLGGFVVLEWSEPGS